MTTVTPILLLDDTLSDMLLVFEQQTIESLARNQTYYRRLYMWF